MSASLTAPPLGVAQLERLRRSIVGEGGQSRSPLSKQEFAVTRAVLDTLGIGLEPVHIFMCQTMPTLSELEQWVIEQVGGELTSDRIRRANDIAGGARPDPARAAQLESVDCGEPVLAADDLAFWERNGYVILRDAASADARRRLERAIWQHVGADPDDPGSWYRGELQQGIMVQLFHAPGIEEIHASPRIHKAFAQLSGTADLVMTADRCGFNPPLPPGQTWTGARMHFDLESFAPPVRPHLQGILYLTDTSEHQGAFRCVTGFHHRIDDWLEGLPRGANPSLQDLESLGPTSIAASAGDLIIWSAALPHGSQPNAATRPRIVHYLSMYPTPRPGN